MTAKQRQERYSRRVPLVDLGLQYAALKDELDAVVGRVLASGQYVGGPEVEEFESEFAQFCGTPHAVAVGSGTDALRFALKAVGVGKSEGGEGSKGSNPAGERAEVVTSPLTFIASAEAISQAGGRPVFADIHPVSLTLDPAKIEQVITSRTAAILPVHLYGRPADLGPILALARRRALPVVEDACQAHGALYDGRPVGSIGDAGCFSFYPTKNLGACGEGGMVTTSRADVAARVRKLRDHGQVEKYRYAEEGYNGRLDALQAAILRVKLRKLAEWNERRCAVAERYRSGLRDLEERGALVALPGEMPRSRHVYHLFAVRLTDRDRVRAELRELGIDSGVQYPVPLHLQPAYAWMGLREGAFPEAERAAQQVLTLPLYPEITNSQVDRVCEALRMAVDGR